MKTLLSALFVLALVFVQPEAQAKRLGGGKSMGQQSSNVTQRDATPPAAPGAPTQNAAAPAKPATPAAAPQAAPKKPWGAMLGGLAAGLGLAWLAHSLGMGEGFGQFLLVLLVAVAAFAGSGVAARQSWMQWYPPAVSECGPGLEYMLESFPLSSALPMIFRGAGDCSAIDWTLLGLTIANWSFLVFISILVGVTIFLLQRHKNQR